MAAPLEEVVAAYNWQPRFQEQKKQEWTYFLPFSITKEDFDRYKGEGWEVLICYDYINGYFTSFR